MQNAIKKNWCPQNLAYEPITPYPQQKQKEVELKQKEVEPNIGRFLTFLERKSYYLFFRRHRSPTQTRQEMLYYNRSRKKQQKEVELKQKEVEPNIGRFLTFLERKSYYLFFRRHRSPTQTRQEMLYYNRSRKKQKQGQGVEAIFWVMLLNPGGTSFK